MRRGGYKMRLKGRKVYKGIAEAEAIVRDLPKVGRVEKQSFPDRGS